jgi:uncharacterized membrane protein
MNRRARPERQEPVTTHRDWWVAALAAAGLLVAGYLTLTKLTGGTALFCERGGGCDAVQASRYATFLGLPTAAWGAILYALVGGLATAGLPARRWVAAFLLAVGGAAFSLYLTWLSLVEIGVPCGWCLTSNGIALALCALLFARRPAVSQGRRSPARLSRVIPLAAGTAVAAVMIGAGVFAWRPPGETAAFAEALAHHLRASGAVMYGAYW